MRKIIIISAVAAILSACATTYDPAEVCTSEWIEPRAEKAVGELVDDTQGAVKSLRKVAEKYMEGKTPGPLTMFSLSNSLKKVENELTKGRGVKDLKILAKTCDDPKIVTDGLTEYVENLGVPDRIMGFVKALPKYQELIDMHLDDLNKP